MTVDRPFTGILLMIGFCFLAPMGDAIAKLLGQTLSVGQLVTVRFAMQFFILLPLVWWLGIRLVTTRRVLILTALRTGLHIIGISAMFLSLKYLPIADAVAIAFVMPFIMLLLGKLVLGEEVGPRRLAACAVGFCGTMLVVQPSFAEVGPPALLPLLVAVVFALFMLVTRTIAKQTDPIALQTVSGFFATCVLIPTLLIGDALQVPGLAVTNPSGADLWLLAALGILGTCAHLLMTWSLRFAPSATVAPVQYLEIPIATLIGWAIFSDLPNNLAAVGISITMASGLYILMRERRQSQDLAAAD